MPRISREHRTPTATHAAISRESTALNETSDCVLRAIAACTGASYATVHAAAAKHGRKPRRGTSIDVTRFVLRELGFSYRVWGYSLPGEPQRPASLNAIIASYPKGHRHLKSCTTHHPVRFPAAWAFAHGRAFMAFTSGWGHVAAIVNGEVHDWARGRPLRISAMWEIVPL